MTIAAAVLLLWFLPQAPHEEVEELSFSSPPSSEPAALGYVSKRAPCVNSLIYRSM
jgi:hypothetical protein